MCPSGGRGYSPDQPFITGPDDLHGWNDTVSTDVRISYQIFPAEHVLDENTVFFAPQQEPLSVVKATRVKNPAEEVLAMDIANGEGDGNGENHSGNGNSFHGYRTHLWPGKMLSAENLPYPNAN